MEKRARRSGSDRCPPPPPANAELLTFEEAAGHLRISRRKFNEFRATDETFPKGHVLSGGCVRMKRDELNAWVASKPRGWSTIGRHGVRRNSPAPEGAEEKEEVRS